MAPQRPRGGRSLLGLSREESQLTTATPVQTAPVWWVGFYTSNVSTKNPAAFSLS